MHIELIRSSHWGTELAKFLCQILFIRGISVFVGFQTLRSLVFSRRWGSERWFVRSPLCSSALPPCSWSFRSSYPTTVALRLVCPTALKQQQPGLSQSKPGVSTADNFQARFFKCHTSLLLNLLLYYWLLFQTILFIVTLTPVAALTRPAGFSWCLLFLAFYWGIRIHKF